MTKFEDGPVAGTTLMLQRAPLYLRAVRDAAGKIDALDQLGDVPAANEELFAYVRLGQPGACHVLIRDKKTRRRSGWYATAIYRVCAEQPEDGVMRNLKKWQAWCIARAAAATAIMEGRA